MDLNNRTILILSPQSWGKMLISKHHYAIALARKGNKVYFLNPPNDPLPAGEKVQIKKSGVHDNLFLVEQALFFPYNLKFHALPLFHLLMRRQIKKILRAIAQPVDIVWSFEIGHFYPFRLFPNSLFKIFHPVDEPLSQVSIDAGNGADIVFSVTQEILDKYAHLGVPRFFINHGLTDEFLAEHVTATTLDTTNIHAGFSGNLLRNDIDRDTMLTIIQQNPLVQFECWGSYKTGESNIGGSGNQEQLNFIQQLQKQQNITLHGAVDTQTLAAGMQAMHMFLICYDVKKDQSRGTNYHKVMEYLSTGKVIVSNNITTYKNQPVLVEMISERENNNALPALFKKVVLQLSNYNAPDLQLQRTNFAKDNTYEKQVERVEKIIRAL
jgi:hypothetical protein